jgi:purine-nucleoside phosphorylase
MGISTEFRKNAFQKIVTIPSKKLSSSSTYGSPFAGAESIKATDADLYWQTVCDLGAYFRLKLLNHFNPTDTGRVDPSKMEFPKVCITLGSGLDAFGETIQDPLIIKYNNLPGLEFMELGNVPGHKKCLIAGRLQDGTPVVALSGRIHTYERNGNVDESALLTAAILDAGIHNLILTNAAGSLDPNHLPGTVMLATSIAKETVPNFGSGLQHPYAGDLFYPAHVVCTEFHERLGAIAAELGIRTFEGSYIQYPGRRYEFPAEIARLANERQQMLQGPYAKFAPGAVGMSTGHEVEAACQHATRPEFNGEHALPLPRVVILSTITNLGAGLSDKPPSHDEVKEEGEKIAPLHVQLLTDLVGMMNEERVAA